MGGAHPKKTKPIYQFWGSDWFFFFGFFWDGILTLNSNTKKRQKIQKKNQKTQKSSKKPVSNFECWPRPMQKKQKNCFQFRILAKANAKKTKKPKKNQCQLGNFKNQKRTKKPMPIYRFWRSDWFFWFLWVSTPPPLTLK